MRDLWQFVALCISKIAQLELLESIVIVLIHLNETFSNSFASFFTQPNDSQLVNIFRGSFQI
jgi:hypothetical protein